MKRKVLLIPLIIFLAIAAALLIGTLLVIEKITGRKHA